MEIDMTRKIEVYDVDNMQIGMTESLDMSELSKGVLGIFKALENLFTDQIIQDYTTENHRIDSKALSKLIEKKQSKGQKHTGEDLGMRMY